MFLHNNGDYWAISTEKYTRGQFWNFQDVQSPSGQSKCLPSKALKFHFVWNAFLFVLSSETLYPSPSPHVHP